MTSLQIFLLEIPERARPVVVDAAARAFSGALVVDVTSVTDAAARAAGSGSCLFVIGSGSPAVKEALGMATLHGQSLWALVALGSELVEGVETVPPAEWNAPLLGRVFRSAVAQQVLRAENLRLVGDLKTLARRISHDLRSPVGSIHTSADVLTEISPDETETIATMAEIVKSSSEEIHQIVDRVGFLMWASAQPSPRTGIEMADVLRHVLQHLHHRIENTSATVTLPSSWPAVNGVAEWLQVIWTNLLNNALQHGGAAPAIVIAWAPDERGFRFTVTDRGAGVPTARQAALFTPFERLHVVKTPGLGLSVVQRLVALQGGQCGHERPAEGGARFYFTLPADS